MAASDGIMSLANDAAEISLAPAVPRSAERGLDWLNLFVANIQTGFGPFIVVYLTTQGWTQSAIGFALSLGTVTSMASQVPAGALVDAARRKSVVAAFSILAFTASAVMFALSPAPLSVYLAEILHGFSSCTLGPAIAALSLAVAGQAMFGVRLGRNARYASIGNGLGAALMGACGYYVSNQAVFFLTAATDAAGARGVAGALGRRCAGAARGAAAGAQASGSGACCACCGIGGSSPLPAAPCCSPWPMRRCCRWRAPRSPSGRAARRAC